MRVDGETRTWLEDARGTDRGADALGEENLVVLCPEAGHHDSEYVQDAADKRQPPRTVPVIDDADKWTLLEGISKNYSPLGGHDMTAADSPGP